MRRRNIVLHEGLLRKLEDPSSAIRDVIESLEVATGPIALRIDVADPPVNPVAIVEDAAGPIEAEGVNADDAARQLGRFVAEIVRARG